MIYVHHISNLEFTSLVVINRRCAWILDELSVNRSSRWPSQIYKATRTPIITHPEVNEVVGTPFQFEVYTSAKLNFTF